MFCQPLCTPQHFQIWALVPQWSDPLLDGVEGDLLPEEDRLETKLFFILTLPAFVLETVQNIQALTISRILHSLC